MVQGTQGTLKGSETSLLWKYFKPEEAAPIKLTTLTLKNEKGEPIYCREKLNFYEESWKAEPGIKSPGEYDADEQGFGYYRALHKSFVNNEEFAITHEHLMLQMKVMGAAHAQNKNLFK